MGVAEGWPTVTVVVCSGLGQAEDLCSHAMALAARAERATVYFILVVVWGSRVEQPSVLAEKGVFLSSSSNCFWEFAESDVPL